jgi:GTP pyrophosphokinase
VLALPRGATPVDFAYAVHTEVGNQCIGAKVNGQIVPLRHRLTNGDVVEILTQKGHVPSRDWLNFVRTSRARSKIRHHINFIERSQATEVGRRLLEREARQVGRSLKKIPEADLLRVASEYGCAKLEDLFADLGYGKFSARQILSNALGEPLGEKPEQAEEPAARLVSTVKRMLRVGEATLQVGGHDDLMVFRAKCCNPIPGDDIVGYVTRGRGVAVHAKSCPNVQNLLYQVERRIDVEWGGAAGSIYPVNLLIRAQDRPGMLADITSVISDTGSNIRTLGSHPDNLHARIELTLEITDRKHLEHIMTNIRKIPGIFGVERLYKV